MYTELMKVSKRKDQFQREKNRTKWEKMMMTNEVKMKMIRKMIVVYWIPCLRLQTFLKMKSVSCSIYWLLVKVEHLLSVFKDKYSEEWAYPNIYCGQNRPDNKLRKFFYYSEICKSELRHHGQRVAQDLQNKKVANENDVECSSESHEKMQMQRFESQSRIIERPSYDKWYSIQRYWYTFLNTVRVYAPYFQAVVKDIFFHDSPAWPCNFFYKLFCSWNPMETPVLNIGEIIDRVDYNDENVESLTWAEKCKLMQSDPAICARHLIVKYNYCLNFHRMNVEPLGPLVDYFTLHYAFDLTQYNGKFVWFQDCRTFRQWQSISWQCETPGSNWLCHSWRESWKNYWPVARPDMEKGEGLNGCRQISNIRLTESQIFKVSGCVMQLSFHNLLKPGVKSRMKM